VSPVTRTRWVTFNCYDTLADRRLRRPLDDVEAVLARLRAKGYKLAVLTNCDDDLFAVTHRSFRKPFDMFVTAERILGYKPAPWHFRAFELITRVRKRDWVHVSSSVFHDIAPAQAFGVRSVWLDRARSSDNAATGSVRVHDAAEIVGAIEYLFDQPADWSATRAEAQLC
jgi:2-haloacid dehalogenase